MGYTGDCRTRDAVPPEGGMPVRCNAWAVCAALVVLAAAAAVAAPIEIPLRLELVGEGGGGFRPGGNRILSVSTQPPEGTWKLPEQAAAGSVYAVVELGGVSRIMVLERADAGDPFYTRLRFDADGDGDVTNDPVLEVKGEGGGLTISERFSTAQFPPIDLRLASGGGTAPYRLRVLARLRGDLAETGPTAEQIASREFVMYTLAACCYAGEFEHGGLKYRFVLGDMNGNGTFDDQYVLSQERASAGDQFFLTEGENVTYSDGVPFGRMLQLKDALFEVSVDTAAARLVLTPCAQPLVSVTLPMAVERLVLCSAADGASVVMHRPGTAVKIPAGLYRVGTYNALKKDAGGDVWTVRASGSPEDAVIEAREGAVLAFGEPFATSVAVPEQSYERFAKGEDKTARLVFQVKGSAGERVVSLVREVPARDAQAGDAPAPAASLVRRLLLGRVTTQRPKEPEYRILTGGGQLVAQGSFEYG